MLKVSKTSRDKPWSAKHPNDKEMFLKAFDSLNIAQSKTVTSERRTLSHIKKIISRAIQCTPVKCRVMKSQRYYG